jgi:hypothetical protein
MSGQMPLWKTSTSAVRLSPMSPLEVAEASLDFLRDHSAKLLGASAAVVVPIGFLSAYLARSAFEGNVTSSLLNGGSFGGSFGQPASGTSLGSANLFGGAASVGTLLFVLGLAVVAAPVCRLVAASVTSRELSLGDAFKMPASQWASVLAACVLVHMAELVGIFGMGVGSLLAMVAFAVVTPVVVLEQAGPLRAMGRSWRLALRRFPPVLGAVLAMSLVTVLLTDATGSALSALPQFVGFRGGWLVAGLGMVLGRTVGFAATASFTAFLYVDMRVISEGMDLMLALAEGPRS